MRRSLFFWLEKLKITPAERKTISVLMVLFIGLSLANMALAPSNPFAGNQYAELDRQFAERTATLELKEQKRMERYFPPTKKGPSITATADTLPKESTKPKGEKGPPEKSKILRKELINVNKADLESLQRLPGIGPAYSKRIILYREQHGEFKEIEELKKINGIGKKRLEKLKPFVKLKDSK